MIAIQSGDYPKALALAEGSPAVVAGSTVLRYNHALIRAVLGRREEALGDLERLRGDDPGFKMTLLLLASLYADEGEYARALEVAAQLSHDLPGEPAGPEAESWLLRKLGRLEEAETRAGEALKMEPRSGTAHLTLAAVAFDRGDHAGAREQLARAERLVPGSTTAALLAAEMALATEDGAEAAVHQAVRAANNNPLSFADKPVAGLVQRLEARRQASANWKAFRLLFTMLERNRNWEEEHESQNDTDRVSSRSSRLTCRLQLHRYSGQDQEARNLEKGKRSVVWVSIRLFGADRGFGGRVDWRSSLS